MKDINELIEAANKIKEYCGSPEGYLHEEDCPFFRGWSKPFGEAGAQIAKCALNLGETPPCEWDI